MVRKAPGLAVGPAGPVLLCQAGMPLGGLRLAPATGTWLQPQCLLRAREASVTAPESVSVEIKTPGNAGQYSNVPASWRALWDSGERLGRADTSPVTGTGPHNCS